MHGLRRQEGPGGYSQQVTNITRPKRPQHTDTPVLIEKIEHTTVFLHLCVCLVVASGGLVLQLRGCCQCHRSKKHCRIARAGTVNQILPADVIRQNLTVKDHVEDLMPPPPVKDF